MSIVAVVHRAALSVAILLVGASAFAADPAVRKKGDAEPDTDFQAKWDGK
jgi:hypothetical protein